MFAPTPKGAAEYPTEVKLAGVIADVHKGVDQMHARTSSADPILGKRTWEIVTKEREFEISVYWVL